MTTHAFLDSLTRRGVRLSAASGRLDIDAPAGVLTAEDHAALAEHKAELVALVADADFDAAIAWLHRRADEIRQTQGVPTPEAERLAYLELKARPDGAPAPDIWTMTASRSDPVTPLRSRNPISTTR
jgi:hypothetical protein